ncbi:DUF4430 domain-containing protein [Streptococcus devriesei]|uniref:DUF4430 domain-containing protein n=1 Tax=Streptococcus devriesei TaxID=231233 RepID=UPI0004279803|nr:DUF4430 domain-containing protein [Streptococcus devriesei]
MKKLLFSISMLLLSLVLIACSNNTGNSSSQKAKEVTVQVIIKPDGKEAKRKSVAIDKGATVMKALKKAYKVEEKDGFITSIDDNKQDETRKLYWMFKVNDKVASKGAEEIKVKKDDKIEFYQEVYK